jgi:glucosamine-6-phosphate deaminase
MRLIVTNRSGDCDREAATIVAAQVRCKPNSVLGLATGNTTRGLFRELVEMHRAGNLDFSPVSTFNVDEYLGLDENDPASIHARMEEMLFRQVNLRRENAYIPASRPASAEQECREFERRIGQKGGIDLLVLSVGCNGHIGFNEPGTPFESTVRVADITTESRQVRADIFGRPEKVPRQGITLGIRDMMRARKILLLAKGLEKAEIIHRALCGAVTPEVPASVLQLHPELTVVLDEQAAIGFRRE